MKAKTIRFLTAICACLLIISAVFFWILISLEIKYVDGKGLVRLYWLNDFSAISTIFLSFAIAILQLLRPTKKEDQSDILD
jgi:hypothetical protein